MAKLCFSDIKTMTDDDIYRFVRAQENMYETALLEVCNGRKESHWVWFVLPQLRGLGRTYNANFYGLKDLEETRKYLEVPVLASRLTEILNELLKLSTRNPEDVFGKLDSMKLKSSMTLFDVVSPNAIFSRVLDEFFNGERDDKTLQMVGVIK